MKQFDDWAVLVGNMAHPSGMQRIEVATAGRGEQKRGQTGMKISQRQYGAFIRGVLHSFQLAFVVTGNFIVLKNLIATFGVWRLQHLHHGELAGAVAFQA